MNQFSRGRWLAVYVGVLTLFFLPYSASCKNPAASTDKQKTANLYQELADLINQAEGRFASINWGQDADEFGVNEYWVPESYKQNFKSAIDAAKTVLQNSGGNSALLKNAYDDLQDALILSYTLEEQGATVKKDTLQTLINFAEDVLAHVEISANGFDISSSLTWVSPQIYSALELSLKIAKEAAENTDAGQYEVDQAAQTLAATLNSTEPRPGLMELAAVFEQAQDALESVEQSADGADIFIFRKWVTPLVYAEFAKAVENAESVLYTSFETAEVENTAQSLNAALLLFNGAAAGGSLTAYIVKFDSDGGISVADQIIYPGEKASEPSGVTRYTIRQLYEALVAADTSGDYIPAGGYDANAYMVVHWKNTDGSFWNFGQDTVIANTTLTAVWSTEPIPYSSSLTYADAVATGNTPIVYVLRDDVSSSGMSLARNNANIIFLGLGGKRTITLTNNLSLFNLNGSSTVTIGKNITLTKSAATGSNPFIWLDKASCFTMLDGSEISGVTTNNEGGVIMNVGVYTRPPAEPAPITATFTMEGGIISHNMVGTNRFTWVSIIMVYSGGGKIIMKGGQITGNNYEANGSESNGYIIPGKRVAGGDICLDRGIKTVPLELSGNAEVDYIFIGHGEGSGSTRPYCFGIDSGWTGKIKSLILDLGVPAWVSQSFVGAAGGHTLTPQDIDRIEALMHYPAVSNPDDGGFPIEDLTPRTDRRISRGENGETIGYLMEVLD